MHLVIEIILQSLLLILACVLYCVLQRRILPRLFFGFRHVAERELGRGVKKFVYEDGRAVLYEPHPSVRKIIPEYLLYTNGGYKYVSLHIDPGVRTLSLTLTMLNNARRVIDVIDVRDTKREAHPIRPILLHADTSYIALTVREVNGLSLPCSTPYSRSISALVGYFLSNLTVTFAFSMLLPQLLLRILYAFDIGLYLDGHLYSSLTCALVVAAFSVLMIALYDKKKGIGIGRHGKS